MIDIPDADYRFAVVGVASLRKALTCGPFGG